MEDHIQLLCWELVAELAEAALNTSVVSPAPVESLPQANTESKTEGPLKPQFFAKRPASAPMLPHPKVKTQLSLGNALQIHTRWQGENVRVQASKGLSSS